MHKKFFNFIHQIHDMSGVLGDSNKSTTRMDGIVIPDGASILKKLEREMASLNPSESVCAYFFFGVSFMLLIHVA